MTLPIIYKKAKTGKIQEYHIETENDMIKTFAGQVDGKLTENITICKPKNVGKANETTAEQQAILEAKSKHAKKIKSGYTLNPNGDISVKLPMKVKTLQEQWDNVIYPCVSTPKLNGVNGTYRLEEDKLNLYSRGGDIRPEIPHLEEHILFAMNMLETNEINVELYKHGEHLQDISSAVTKTKDLSKVLQAGIFDFVKNNVTYSDRRQKMITVENTMDIDGIYFLNGEVCNTKEDIETHYEECMDAGLEGTVIKNLRGLYKHNERSSDQFKYKKAIDSEFQVVGYSLDKSNHAVFICKTPLGNKFKVKLKGTDEERLAMAEVANSYVDKWLKIEFETYSKDLIPLKPVGIAFRECDDAGNPLE